jgi:hypothetical protein
MRYARRSTTLAALCIIVSGCAAAGAGGGGSENNSITRADIVDGQFTNAYDIVQRLRPRWLRTPRAPTSFRDGVPTGDPLGDLNQGPSRTQVYLDDTFLGAIDSLRRISADAIESVQWFDGTQATQRYGTGNDAGAILVNSRPR